MAADPSPSRQAALAKETETADPNVYNENSSFWAKYRRGRPRIPPSFYDRFFTHHATAPGSNQSFSSVLDVGCGFGELSLHLARRFANVSLLDPAPSSLAVAKEYFASAVAKSKSKSNSSSNTNSYNDDDGTAPPLQSSQFSFLSEKIEATSLATASVDAVFCTSALHWMEPGPAVESMARVLKPGGTLFIATCGIARWNHPEIQKLWWRLLHAGVKATIAKNPAAKQAVQRSAAVGDTGYDCVCLPETEWMPGSVVRLKLNMLGEEDALVFAPGTRGDVPLYESKVGERDRIVEETEEEWFFEKDLQGIKEVFESYPFEPMEAVREEIYGEMEEILEGLEGGKVGGRWPVSIIMATRKGGGLKG